MLAEELKKHSTPKLGDIEQSKLFQDTYTPMQGLKYQKPMGLLLQIDKGPVIFYIVYVKTLFCDLFAIRASIRQLSSP